MADGDRDRQQEERSTEPANPREHVREMEEHLRELGEHLREMGEHLRHTGEQLRRLDEKLSHLEAQDDSAVDRGRGWPTGG
jgi:chromosome segregation ATPase